MKTHMTYHFTDKKHLSDALFSLSHDKEYRVGNFMFAKVSSIEREDDSGKRFSVTGYGFDGVRVTIYVETSD